MKKIILIIIAFIILFFSLDLLNYESNSIDDKMHSFENNITEQTIYHESYSNSNTLGNIALGIEDGIIKIFSVFKNLLEELFSKI